MRRGNLQHARQSLCDAYRAAVMSDKLAVASGELVVSRNDFLTKPFPDIGQAISDHSSVRGTKKLVRELKAQVERQGAGACGGTEWQKELEAKP